MQASEGFRIVMHEYCWSWERLQGHLFDLENRGEVLNSSSCPYLSKISTLTVCKRPKKMNSSCSQVQESRARHPSVSEIYIIDRTRSGLLAALHHHVGSNECREPSCVNGD